MKSMKRIVSVVLLVVMLFAFAACGGNEENPSGTSTGDYDFDGATITIYCDENTGSGDDNENFLSYASSSVEAETLQERIAQMEEDYNCTIEVTTVATDIEKQVSSLIASNSKGSVDIIFARSYYLRKWGNADYLVDVNEYSDIVDYTDSFRWGTKNTLELLTCNGKMIGVTPACFVDQLPPFYYVIVSNDKLVMDAGFLDPNVYLEEGTWNRDTFIQMIDECTDASRGIYGLDTGVETFLTLSMLSNGAKIYDETTGRTGFRGTAAVNGLSWGVDVLNNHSASIYLNDDFHEMLYAGNAALGTCDAVETSKTVAKNTSISDSTNNTGFSILNFPYGPDVSEEDEANVACGYISTTLNALCIPIIASDVEMSAVVMETLFRPLDIYPDFESLKAYYKNSIYWDDNDVELIYSLAEKAEYNYWVEGFSNVLDTIANNAMTNGANAALESVVNTIDNMLTQNGIIENKEGFATYWE